MKDRYSITIHKPDGSVMLHRPWGVSGGSEEEQNIEALYCLIMEAQKELRYLRAIQRKRAA
jgi:ATP-dependent protease ClpP protease subunit